jgi:O-antigen ligase
MSLRDFATKQGFRAWLARAFFAVFALTALAYGSVAEAPLNLAAIAFALLAGLSLFYPIGAESVGRVYAATILLLAVLLAYVILQAAPFAPGYFANGPWKSADELIGPVHGAISVAPGMTLDALATLTMPFLAFLSGLALFQGDDEALLLWRALAYFGVAYGIFGILQYLFLPGQLLFAKNAFSVGRLTASFVNPDTAGTFFGLALLLNLGLTFHSLREIRLRSFVKKLANLEIRWRDENARVLLHALFCIVVAVALFLTQSRGAVGASFVGALIAVVFMGTRPLTGDRPTGGGGRWRRYTGLLGGVIVIVGLFALFAGRVIHRMETQGSDDGRFCVFASTIEAIKDHPILGTGFGTFQDVFPAYRNAECAGIFGFWERAHNVLLEGFLGLGLAFAVALVAGYAILIGAFLRGVRSRHKFRFAPVMGLAALVLVSLHSLVDFSLQIPGVAVYFAAIMASSVTISLGRGTR